MLDRIQGYTVIMEKVVKSSLKTQLNTVTVVVFCFAFKESLLLTLFQCLFLP